MYTYAWTIFGYYGGPTMTTNYQQHCSWYTVDDFGDLVPATYKMDYLETT